VHSVSDMISPETAAGAKALLRRQLRAARKAHVAALPARMQALLFLRPPGAILPLVPEGAVVGLYHATATEAPTAAYARWFAEQGRQVALPWFADKAAPMAFRLWASPWDEATLVADPHGARQPEATAAAVTPDVVFVPLVGFTAEGQRLGQGGGHYDRWLAAHPAVPAIGLAWDCQLVEAIPAEAHDHPLRAIITPTRLFGEMG